MQEAVDRENSRPDWPPIGLRIGISVGEATVEGDDYFGTPVVEAARLCACGDAGQILFSNDNLRRYGWDRWRQCPDIVITGLNILEFKCAVRMYRSLNG